LVRACKKCKKFERKKGSSTCVHGARDHALRRAEALRIVRSGYQADLLSGAFVGTLTDYLIEMGYVHKTNSRRGRVRRGTFDPESVLKAAR